MPASKVASQRGRSKRARRPLQRPALDQARQRAGGRQPQCAGLGEKRPGISAHVPSALGNVLIDGSDPLGGRAAWSQGAGGLNEGGIGRGRSPRDRSGGQQRGQGGQNR